MKTPNPNLHANAGMARVEVIFIIFVVVVIVGFLLPVFSVPMGPLTDSVSNAKQIAMALKLYAGDHNGRFPFARTDGTPLGPNDSSNRAFEHLMSEYATGKEIFFNKKSAWCRKHPKDRTATDSTRLKQGQNDWNYVVGLSEKSDPEWPLIATATASATDLTYTNDKIAKGGVWGGTDAVIGYLDGRVMVLSEGAMNFTDKTKTFPKRPDNGANMLIVTPDWLGTGSFILAPQ